jgi:hypothetical protein
MRDKRLFALARIGVDAVCSPTRRDHLLITSG